MTQQINRTDLQSLPHSTQAEQAVLGCLLLDAHTWDEVGGLLKESDFFLANHRPIFGAIRDLVAAQKPIDPLIITDHLRTSNKLDTAAGEAYIYEICAKATGANALAYADIVKDNAIRREIIKTAQELIERCVDNSITTTEILDESCQKLFALAQGSQTAEPQKLSQLMPAAFERLSTLEQSRGQLTGLPTHFIDLDHITAGLQPGDLILVAGRPSMGKTTLAMNIAENAVLRSSATVLIFSMEMSASQLAMRLLTSHSRVSNQRVRVANLSDEEWRRLGSSTSTLSQGSLYIDDTAALTPMDVRSRSRRLAKKLEKLDLILIDYLQLIHAPGFKQNRTLEISEISRSLKNLARELNVPIIALSQLNRNLENRQDKRPVMSDLRDSGSLEQDADLIAFIYRDEVYNESTRDKGIAELIVAKQRNGPIGRVSLRFSGEHSRFDSLTNQFF